MFIARIKSAMTLSITTFSIMGLFSTFSIMILSITLTSAVMQYTDIG